MGKRGRDYGAVYHRPDGRWEGQIRIPGGHRRSFYARTRRDVIRRLAEARWALGQGLPVSSGTQPLSVFFARWLALTRPRLRPTTMRAYTINVGRLTPFLGRVPLRSITPGMIESTYASLLRSGLSDRTVEQAHAVLHRALNQAMHWGLASRNPTELVTPPRPRTREMTALSRAQLRHFLQVTTGTRWHALWTLLGTTGLRLGEALGLTWRDIDLETGKLIIQRSLQRQPGGGLVFVPPKTERSRRTVHLPELTRRALLAQREVQQCHPVAGGMESDLVFTSLRGGAVEPSEINRALTRELHRAGLPHIRVHDLRHTTASLLLEAGTHPKIVQDLLGHSTIRLTLDTYSHLTPPLHQASARTMDLLLNGLGPIYDRTVAGSTPHWTAGDC
jgi:integrase